MDRKKRPKPLWARMGHRRREMPAEGAARRCLRLWTLISWGWRVPAQVLRTFDSMISSNCTQELENTGVEVWKHTEVQAEQPHSLSHPFWRSRDEGKLAFLGAARRATALAVSLVLRRGHHRLLQGKSHWHLLPSVALVVPRR